MPKKSKKADSELEVAYLEKVDHCVQRVDQWLAKTFRAIKSRKYKLTEDQKTYILNHLGESFTDFQQAVAGSKETKTTFTLKAVQ